MSGMWKVRKWVREKEGTEKERCGERRKERRGEGRKRDREQVIGRVRRKETREEGKKGEGVNREKRGKACDSSSSHTHMHT